MIQKGLKPEHEALVRKFTTAKDAWMFLENSIMGSQSIQHSKFDKVQDQADNFVMNEDETPEELYRRLTLLAIAMIDHGSKDTDDQWI